MKILMINVVCGIRSTGRICTDLALALEAQGHEVKIAYGREIVPERFQKYAVRIGSNLDVQLHGVKARLLDAAGFGSISATKKFIKWVKEYDPDVIHLHNIHGYYINVDILFKYLKTCGKKIIWTLHDCWAFTGHTAYCDVVNCKRWVNGCYNCPLLKAYPSSLLDNSRKNWKKKRELFIQIPNLTIVTPSNWMKTCVKNSFLKDYQVKVINNGINTEQFRYIESEFRVKYSLSEKVLILGVATSWDDMKGYSDFIKLSQLLNDNYRIILVGLSHEQVLHLPENVLGIERTANVQELVEIYSSSDLFLNLSYCENYPTVNLEANACGLPIITYDTGGSPESAGDQAIVIGRGDIDSLEHIIIQGDWKERIPNKKIHDYADTLMEYLNEYE